MRNRSSIRVFGAIALAALVAVLAGCSLAGRTGAEVERLAPQTFAPRPADYPISLTQGDYQEPYTEIAAVRTDFYEERHIEARGNAQLREMARETGGDAVIGIARENKVMEKLDYQPGGYLRTGTEFKEKAALTGVVVRFTRGGER
jgi:hypothetical protein